MPYRKSLIIFQLLFLSINLPALASERGNVSFRVDGPKSESSFHPFQERLNSSGACESKQIHAASSEPITELTLPAAFIKCSPDADINANDAGDSIQVNEGDVLIVGKRPVTLYCRNAQIMLSKDAVMVVSQRQGTLKIRSLGMSPSRAQINGFAFDLYIGQELILADSLFKLQESAQSDAIGRRRASLVQFSNNQEILRCEFAPVTLMKASPLLRELVHRREPLGRAVGERLIKTAASLGIVTAGHGNFYLVAPVAPFLSP